MCPANPCFWPPSLLMYRNAPRFNCLIGRCAINTNDMLCSTASTHRPLSNHHIHNCSGNSSLTPVCKTLTHISPLTEPLLITEISRGIQFLSVNIPSSVVIFCHVWNNILSHLFFPINKCPEKWRPSLCCTFSWSCCKYFSCICVSTLNIGIVGKGETHNTLFLYV